jgi:hypothetical protein
MASRERLLQKIQRHGLPEIEGPLPVVSLEDFFVGNSDERSIGRRLPDHPGVTTFFTTLRTIRERPDVQDVLVEIYDVNEVDDWPYAQRVYIITSASERHVAAWLETLRPSEVAAGWQGERPRAAPSRDEGMYVYAATWT